MIRYFIPLFLSGIMYGQAIDLPKKTWIKNIDFFSEDSMSSFLDSIRDAFPSHRASRYYGYIDWNHTQFVKKTLIVKCINQTSDGGYIISGSTTGFGSGTSIDYKTRVIRARRAGAKSREANEMHIKHRDEGWSKVISEIKNKGLDKDTEEYMLDMAKDRFELKKKLLLKESQEWASKSTDLYARVSVPSNTLGLTSKDAYLMKVDANGNFEWVKTFGRMDVFDQASFVQETSDGGYIAIGYDNNGTDAKCLIVKTDFEGNEEWNTSFGTNAGYTYPASAQETSDGGFVITGSSTAFLDMPMAFQAFLVKIDKEGTKEWQNLFPKGGEYPDFSHSFSSEGVYVRQTRDNGYIVVTENEYSSKKMSIFKYDSEGNEKWRRDQSEKFLPVFVDDEGNELWDGYNSPISMSINSIQHTPDGGFIMTGNEYAFSVLMKVDSLGNEEWRRFFSDKSSGEVVCKTEDGGYAVLIQNENPMLNESYEYVPHESDIVDGKLAEKGIIKEEPPFYLYLIKTDSNGNTRKPSIPVDSARSIITKRLIKENVDSYSGVPLHGIISRGYENWIPENIYWENGKWIFDKELEEENKKPNSILNAIKSVVKCYCYSLLFLYIFTPS